MSASERLAALGEEARRHNYIWPDSERLWATLPEIVAVVKAAEILDELMWDDGTELDAESFGLRMASQNSALAALEEKLKP